MIANTDLHIHPLHNIHQDTLRLLAVNASLKGLNLLGCGDCLQDSWRNRIVTECRTIDEGTFEYYGIRFILSVEIETRDRIHHLIYFPSLSAVEEFKSNIKRYSSNLDKCRPVVNLLSWEVAELAVDVDALIGPAHIFNSWRGVYGIYNSIENCYKDLSKHIHFVELGLNGDTDYADRIQELHRLTFLSNSDTHNYHPMRLGREFTRFKVRDLTFEEIKKAILHINDNKPILNVGLPPEESKYNQSACPRCHRRYTEAEAEKLKWRCVCGKPIRKGISHRIEKRANFLTPQHPIHRPPYLKFLPLGEIIKRALNQKNPFLKTVQEKWRNLISIFGNEIRVLIDVPLEDIARVTTPSILEVIAALREGNVFFKPGGGGEYGKIIIPNIEERLVVSLKPEEKRLFLI